MAEEIVYLDGEFVPYSQARLPVEDRGLNFADGIYEVVRVVGGRLFHIEDHLARLEHGIRALEIPLDRTLASIAEAMAETARRNGVVEGTVYLQLTRGVALRKHGFPETARPTLFMLARPFTGRTPAERAGVACITVPDTRWALCEIKTTGLLPNVLAYERARRAGAYEAIFVRDGVITEGAHTSVFAVLRGVVYTHPIRNILPGVTRAMILDYLKKTGSDAREEPVPLPRFREADEIFITGTTTEVLPVVRLDGRQVGSGVLGPVTGRLADWYQGELERARAPGAPGRSASRRE